MKKIEKGKRKRVVESVDSLTENQALRQGFT